MREPLISVARAEGCAWRGRYVKVAGRMLCSLVVDPASGNGPVALVALPVGLRRAITRRLYPRLARVTVPLPRVSWRMVGRFGYGPVVTWLYRASQRFWHRFDGRLDHSVMGALAGAVEVLRAGPNDPSDDGQTR